MKFVADLHVHSKYSRAVSKDMTLEELDRWADDKGILIMGTGDFTHPAWFKEIKEKLEPAEPGLFKLRRQFKLKTIKGTFAETRFMLTVEISNIYSRNGRVRRIHNLVFAPDMATAEKINAQLSWVGNLKSDGRPILGMDSQDLVKIALGANSESVVVPAHAWTPWFSVFGSMSGFDSLEECFGEYTKHIFAIETGLSSDPAMNWRLSKLDQIALISNSDSHSLQRIGREANVFDTELSYAGIISAIKSSISINPQNQHKSASKFLMTIEFFPEEGKYHYDGHRLCGVSWEPAETKNHNGICERCGKPVTVGVMNRIDALADRPERYEAPNRVPFRNLIALDEIIGEALGVGKTAKAVKKEYDELIKNFGSELAVLLDVPAERLRAVANALTVEGIERVRAGKVKIRAGYDGEYGKIKIFEEGEQKEIAPQAALF